MYYHLIQTQYQYLKIILKKIYWGILAFNINAIELLKKILKKYIGVI